jgi:hypothetical protein
MRWVAIVLALVSSCRCDDRRAASKPGQASTPPSDARTARRNWSPPAAPSLPAWSAAESAKTADAWERAADAYATARAACDDDCIDSAYAVVLARKNAIEAVPIAAPPADGDAPPLPAREQALVAALDDYVAIAPPGDPDVLDMKFLAANVLNRWHQDEAIERLEELLREHRDDPSAEYVANMLLDALMRANRIDELKRWVNELLADAAFLAGKDQLRALLEMLRTRLQGG